jgi:hypothetical protein
MVASLGVSQPVSQSVGRSRVAVAEARIQFRNPDERERRPLEAVTR